MTAITNVEGIGEAYGAKLAAAGIATQEALLEAGASRSGRSQIAKDTEISDTLILKWVNRADLSRIKGISTQYADLLEASGVDTVPELAQRNAENLLARMAEVNDDNALVRQLPTLGKVENWIDQAKSLPRVITH
ncbi:DUF4332 domain-containing protein [Ferrimonas balearica]|uniref:DUF4332 domain-containing protein n=1 Tax=Ferrimonas balearica TaxID=44012 RepID=UPI001C961F14|nr:DUF4332 domain-containing protein [Ferrimonas balearica]MBY6224046.1 DUF4332 domain-containing protein [Ferrimonas balearica]